MSESQVETKTVPVVEATVVTEVPAVPENVFDELSAWEPHDEDALVPDVTEPVEKPAAKVVEPVVETKPAPAVAKPAEVKPVETKPTEVKTEAKAAPAQDQPPITAEQAETNIETYLSDFFSKSIAEKDWEDLETNPRQVIPKLLAKQALWNYKALYHVFGNQIPHVIRTTLKADSTASERESAFYSQWPELGEATKAGKVKAEQLAQIGSFWRSQNPEASQEQAVEGIGRMAMSMYGIERKAPAPAAKPQAIPPKTPARVTGGPAKPTVTHDNVFADLATWEPTEEE